MRRWGLALYVLLCLIWGSTWLVIKVGYGGLGPFNVAAVRFFIAGAVMTVAAWMTGARWPRGPREWRAVAVVGLLMFAADYGLIYWAEQYIESGLTAVLFATLPLMTLFVARAYLPGERITARKLTSSLLALVGTIALFADRLRLDSGTVAPMLAVLAGGGLRGGRQRRQQAGRTRPAGGDAERAVDADRGRCVARRLAGARRRLSTPSRRRHVGRRRLPVGRRHGARLLHLLLAAQDLDGDEPCLHLGVHAGDCAAARFRLSRRAAKSVDRGRVDPDSAGNRACLPAGAGAPFLTARSPFKVGSQDLRDARRVIMALATALLCSLNTTGAADRGVIGQDIPSRSPRANEPGRVVATITVLEGTVRLGGVDVALRSVDGNQVLAQTISDGVGQVTVPDVPPGRYVVEATRPGFVATTSAPFEVRGRRDGPGAGGPSIDLRRPERRGAGADLANPERATGVDQRHAVGIGLDLAPLEGDDFQSLLPLLPGDRPRVPMAGCAPKAASPRRARCRSAAPA